ncbi:Smr/MutS family protein [Patescibacteria group bacterium]|nr:Smr/MutS family protein [Patescibacteria group bacterium]
MAKHKSSKKQKTNKYDNLSKPEAEFDFHGRGYLTMPQVQKLADDFIQEALRRDLTKILFITGKGIHSEGGMPKIKPFLRKYLQSHPRVLRVYEGRRDRGGEGTLEVVLD